jgi:hypothetical protein
VSDPSPRRRFSLEELQQELAQVAPVEADDFGALADAVGKLLADPKGQEGNIKRLDKAALWSRVEAEIDALGTEGGEDA